MQTRSPPLNNLAAKPEHSPSYRFGRFELQPTGRRLLADNAPVALGARAFDLLVALVARSGQLVSKNDLLTLVWPGLVVEENNLQVQISSLRKLLGPQAIATIPGRGYRFVAPLNNETLAAGGSDVPAISGLEAAAAARPSQTNLPLGWAPLLGRSADVLLLESLLASHRLVTLVGAGGIGKSRLALAVAKAEVERRRDGAWWIELAGLAD